MKEKRKYLFYYHFVEGGKKRIVKIKECIKPERTNEYKFLEDNFNDGFIYSFGYEHIK
jgi:hypothetical protein